MKVYLCADASGRYVHIRCATVDAIEDAGLEVVEDQSIDYKGCSIDELKEDTILLSELKDSDAILFD
jgi:hypothetical protein